MAIERIELLIPAEYYSNVSDVDNMAGMINDKINNDLGAALTEILGYEHEVVVSLGELSSYHFEYIPAIKYRQDLTWKPLVRCKNCKYQGGLNFEGRHTCRHSLGLIVADDDSFCSYGDKKEV